jgi:hypothetical protein
VEKENIHWVEKMVVTVKEQLRLPIDLEASKRTVNSLILRGAKKNIQ